MGRSFLGEKGDDGIEGSVDGSGEVLVAEGGQSLDQVVIPKQDFFQSSLSESVLLLVHRCRRMLWLGSLRRIGSRGDLDLSRYNWMRWM